MKRDATPATRLRSRNHLWRMFAICCPLLALIAPKASAGAPASPYAGDAVVATVTKVSTRVATFADPPHITLEVQEVLQGDPGADRRDALWEPPPHDIDTGVITDNPRYKAWAAHRIEAPPVGSRWILYGRSWAAAPEKNPVFFVASEAAVPFSDEAHTRAVAAARQLAESRKRGAIEAEADRRANARIRSLWRALAVPHLPAYADEADVIVTGRWVGAASTESAAGIEVTSVPKGELRAGPDRQKPPRYVDVPVTPALELVLDRDVEYLFFLSSKDATFNSTSPRYPRIRSGDGIVIADEQTLAAVRNALRRSAGPAEPGRTPRNRTRQAPSGR